MNSRGKPIWKAYSAGKIPITMYKEVHKGTAQQKYVRKKGWGGGPKKHQVEVLDVRRFLSLVEGLLGIYIYVRQWFSVASKRQTFFLLSATQSFWK